MAEPIDTEVLIIGGGPTGMVAALCLDQLGIHSIVLERQAGIKEHPKAHELSGRSIEILKGLGFTYDELSREASPYADACKIVFCDDLSQEYGTIDISKGAGADAYAQALPSPWPFLNISQVELEKVILQRLSTRPCIDMRWNQQWESMEEGPDAVLSQVTDRATGASFAIRSRYVLCADGAGSRSRKALGIEMVGPEKIRDFVNIYLEMDLSGVVQTKGKLYFCLSPDVPGVTLIAHHIERRWVLNAPMIGEETADAYNDERLVALTRRAIARDDVPIQVKSMSRWRMTAQVADAFRRGRALLIGDAAHRFPPTGGLGMNSGIGDAHNLCWKLAAVLRGVAPDSLIETYEEERRPVIQVNCDASQRNFERMMDVHG